MIAELHTALLERLSAALPAFSVQAYPRYEARIALPAAMLALDTLELAEAQNGTEQTAMQLGFSLRLIAAPEQANAELALRIEAANLMHLMQRWPCLIPRRAGQVRLRSASASDFRPELDGYLVFEIEFELDVLMGDIDTTGLFIPHEVYVSWDPRVGLVHEHDYIRAE